MTPNIEEVGEWFTVPIMELLDEKNWTIREFSAPIFRGGPHPVWGLTGYLLRRFLDDVVLKGFKIKGQHYSSLENVEHEKDASTPLKSKTK